MRKRHTHAIRRRDFLKGSAAFLGAAALSPSILAQDLSEVRIGVIGLRTRGAQLLNTLRSLPGVTIAALCDVDEKLLQSHVLKLSNQGIQATGTRDMRRVFDRKDIDAVILATPNHWHALGTVWACQAGKDVYVEKPISHNIWEGRQMVRAASRYKRIVQSGLQNRSDTGLREFLRWHQEGNLGKVKRAHTVWFRVRQPIGRVTSPTRVPSHIDYNLFCGPRNAGPLLRQNLHYDWHWQWAYGNGEMGNLGVHILDECRWMLGLDLPRRVLHVGDRCLWNDDGETPNMSLVACEFDELPLICEIRDLPVRTGSRESFKVRDSSMASIFHCEGGVFQGSRGGGAAFDLKGKRIRNFKGDSGASHVKNFIDAVRSRRKEDLRCNIEEGHKSTTLGHLANITYRLGRRSSLSEIQKSLEDHEHALGALDTLVSHAQENGADLEKTPLRHGRWVEFDGQKERFTGGESLAQANAMLRESYRAPFVVPEEV